MRKKQISLNVKKRVTPQISAGKHRITTALNCVVAPQFATELDGENFLKEHQAAPSTSIIHRIVEEM